MEQGIEYSVQKKIRLITFCNNKKRNALSPDDYEEIGRILNMDAKDDKIIGTIFTGSGDYFCSGNNLSINTYSGFVDIETQSKAFLEKFVGMLYAFINYPKLIAIVINGPAIGIGFTMIALSDIAIASEAATFSAPFVKLGLCIECCASYLLPRILGRSKASEVLLLGHKLTAKEALTYKLISKIIAKADIPQLIANMIDELSALPMEQVIYNKKLMTDYLKPHLIACAKREAEVLSKCLTSEFFINNVFKFVTKNSKL